MLKKLLVLPTVGIIAFLLSTSVASAQVAPPLQRLGLGTLSSLAYSPDGKYVATGGGIGVVLWDVESAQIVRILSAPNHGVSSVKFSPDGTKILTGSYDQSAKLWDVATGILIRTFSGHNNYVVSVDFSADGSKVLTGSADSTAKLWDAATGTLIRTFSGHTFTVTSVAFSPDGTKVLTGSEDSTAKLWGTVSGIELRTYSGHANRINTVAISADGTKILTGSDDKTAKMWNATTGMEIRTLSGHTAPVASVAFSPDGANILTGSWDNTVKLWDPTTGSVIRTLSFSNSAVFSHDGTKILTSGEDEAALTANLWDAATGDKIATFSGHTNEISAAAFSLDGTMAVTANGIDAELREAATGRVIHTLKGHTLYVSSVAFSPDGTKILTGSGDRTAKLWDAQTGALIRTFSGHTSFVNSVAFSPNGTKVLTGAGDDFTTDSTARLWDIATGAEIRAFSGHTFAVSSVAFSPDGMKVLTGSWDGTAKLWEAATGDEITTFSVDSGWVLSVAFSPDGTKVLTGAEYNADGPDYTATIWDAATGAKIRNFLGHIGDVYSVAFSPDGTKILTGSGDQTAKLWDGENGAELRTFLGHTDYVESVAFSPDGALALTSGLDGTARTWEINPPRTIIVAGGGDFAGNGIAQQTDDLAAYAFRTLKGRGYDGTDIQYLSAFGSRDADDDGLNDVDGASTLDYLHNTLTGEFCTSAGRLLILMLDHGYRTNGFMAFRMNPTQAVSTLQMKQWLDELQTSHSVDVTLVVDSCYSGQFVDDLASAPLGRKRTIIASTTSTAEAVFLPPPDLSSFMQTFLSSAYMGNSLGQAWRAGSDFFNTFKVANQVPQINDGSTSTTNADREFFGVSWAYGVQSTLDINQFFPAFESWTSNTTIGPTDPVTISCRMLENQMPLNVSVAIRPPAPGVLSGDPVTTLPRVSLTSSTLDSRLWSATVPGGTIFAQTGGYSLSFVATFDNARLSRAVYGSVSVNAGPDPDDTPIRGILAVGDSSDGLLNTALVGQGPVAYRAFLDRFQSQDGVKHPEWIDYYSHVSQPVPKGPPSSSEVLSSIAKFDADTTGGRLYVHLVGTSDATAGSVRMAPGDYLTTTALKTALDDWQSSGPNRVAIVSIDAPGSGEFITGLANPTHQRVVITSGRSNDAALFLPSPLLTSFTQKYLGTATQGNSILSSFTAGKNFFQGFLRYLISAPIQPQLDDNGSGKYDFMDGKLAGSLYLGRRYAFAGDEAAGLPFILDGTTTQTAAPGALVTYNTTLIEGIVPTRVYVQIVPDTVADSTPITSLQEINFARTSPTSWTWSATFNAPAAIGTYNLLIYADYPNPPGIKSSEPFFTALVVEGVTSVMDDQFTISSAGWGQFGSTTSTQSIDYDSSATAILAHIEADSGHNWRIVGWITDPGNVMHYNSVGSDHFVRAKYYVYASGQSGTAINEIPNFRMRVANRFAVSSLLTVNNHYNADPEATSPSQDIRPSTSPLSPSIYRVDMDPIDVPYLVSNPATEGFLRAFEVYEPDPQANGSIALTESVLGTYPSLEDFSTPALVTQNGLIKTYMTNGAGGGDFGTGNISSSNSAATIAKYHNGILETTGPQPGFSVSAAGVTLETLSVESDRFGIAAFDVFNDTIDQANHLTRARVEPDKQYKLKFHATSTRISNTQSLVRFRARTIKFQYTASMEVGGPTGASIKSNTIAAQALPGVGNQISGWRWR